MSSSIKVDSKVKSEIDKLQAKFTLKTGEKISQQELLRRIIEFASNHEDEFQKDYLLDWSPPSDQEWSEIKSHIYDFGFKTSESTIDKELYG
jgi:hypothetical protein